MIKYDIIGILTCSTTYILTYRLVVGKFMSKIGMGWKLIYPLYASTFLYSIGHW